MSIYIDLTFLRLISSRLRNFKQKKDDLFNFSCPFCGDSQKNKSKARGFIYRKNNGYFYKCYNCSYGTNVGGLVEHVDPSLYQEYILEKYKEGETGKRKTKTPVFNIPIPKFGKIDQPSYMLNAKLINDLPLTHSCLKYIKKRNIPEKFYNILYYTDHYKQLADEVFPNHGVEKIRDDTRLVIPYFNEYNELIALSGRSLEKGKNVVRYVTINKNPVDKKPVYGMDRVSLDIPVRVVEGPLDSLFVDNCVASGDSNLLVTGSKFKSAVLIFDNENRNVEIVKLMKKAIDKKFKIVIWPSNIVEKDINDMIVNGKSQEYIENVIVTNTFSDIEANLKLNMWKKV
ncbi:DNA primase [Candidatus Dojkabacteria bacterium]|jgi:transcription elongation factor Elf1|nr:DNA primase [Candidatus Dojkabacteria bacterium]